MKWNNDERLESPDKRIYHNFEIETEGYKSSKSLEPFL